MVLLLTLLGPAATAVRAAPGTNPEVRTVQLSPAAYDAAFDARTDHVFLHNGSTNTVEMRDAKDGALLRTVTLPTAMTNVGASMLVAEQEGRLFVGTSDPGYTASGAVSTIDTATGRLLRSIAMGGTPQVLLVDETSKRVLVRSDSSHFDQGLQVRTSMITLLDAQSGQVVVSTAIPGALDAGLADDPGRERTIVVYQLNSNYMQDMTYGLIDTRTGSFTQIADRNQNGELPLLDLQRGRAMIVDVDEGTVHVVDIASGAVQQTIQVDAFPEGGALDPNTGLGYVVSLGRARRDGDAINCAFSTLDLARGVVTRRVVIGDNVVGLSLNARGDRAFIALGAEQLAIVDTKTAAVLNTLPIGAWLPVISAHGLAYNLTDSCVSPGEAVDQSTCGRLAVIDEQTGGLLRMYPVGFTIYPSPIADPARGTLLFVTSTQAGLAGYPSGPGTVTVLQATSGMLLAQIPVGIGPHAIGLDASTDHLLLLNTAGDGTAPPSANPAEPVCSNKTATNVANPPPCRRPYESLSIVALPS